MKNNIILILIVTIVSLAVIVITIALSAGNANGKENSSSEQITSAVTTEKQPVHTAPAVTEKTTADTTTSAATSDTHSDTRSEPPRIHDEDIAKDIISLARAQIGIEFADDGASPQTGFDNSGFIYYCLRENGYITCPRGLVQQSEMGSEIAYENLKPGDLVFFSENGSSAEFGGIYVGEGIMIACLMPGTSVKEINITADYYHSNFFKGVAVS